MRTVALGVLLLVVPPLAWAAGRPVDAVGTVPTAAGPAASGRAAAVGPVTATAVAGAVDAARWPVALAVPALAAVLPVEPVGLDAAGDVAVPSSPARVGWDRRAAVPGAPGTAVLAAHVDSRTEGLGAFAGLVELGVGDRVVVTDASGAAGVWTVVAREAVPKAELPSDRLAALDGPPTLALVTCGGAFDPVARRYAENVIVWAVPAGEPGGAPRS